MKVFILLLIMTSISYCEVDKYLDLAEKAVQEGFLTQMEADIYKQEINKKEFNYAEYSSEKVNLALNLNILGLFKDVDKGYKLAEPVNRVEALGYALELIGKKEKSLAGNFTHPYKNIPKEFDGIVGYAHQENIIPIGWKNSIEPNKQCNYDDYITIILNILGYKEGISFTSENLDAYLRNFNFGAKPYNGGVFNRANIVLVNSKALETSFSDSNLLLKFKLIDEGILDKNKLQLIEDYFFTRYHGKYDDVVSRTLWKYEKKYDFIFSSDYRGAPSPIHHGIRWENKNIVLDFSGEMNIKETEKNKPILNDLLREILLELGLNQKQLERAIGEFQTNEEYTHIDYYTRAIKIKKRKDVIDLEFFLEGK